MHELKGRVISPLQDGNDSIGAHALALDPVIYSTSLAIVNDSYGCTSNLWRDIAFSNGEAVCTETSSHADIFSRSISSLPAVRIKKKETREKEVSSSFHQVKDRRNTSSLKKARRGKERAPQRLFSNDVHRRYSNESTSHSETSRMRLTTNVARKVEMMDPNSMIRKVIFKSCSDAAKHMGINRTKLSRTCRSGGGIIMNNYFRYLECGSDDFKTSLPFCTAYITEPSLDTSEFNGAAILPSEDTSILRCSTPDLCPLDYFSPIGSPQNFLPAAVGIVTPASQYDAIECLELPPPCCFTQEPEPIFRKLYLSSSI